MDFTDRFASHIRLAILLSLLECPPPDRQRLSILDLLAQMPGGAATASILTDCLVDYGFAPSRDDVAADLSWLARSRLVTLPARMMAKPPSAPGEAGAMILDLGREVANGRVTVAGVAPAATVSWLQNNLADLALRQGVEDIRSQLDFLAGQGLIIRRAAEGGFATRAAEGGFATHADVSLITRIGQDVALGRAAAAGVKAPSSSTIMRIASDVALGRLGG